MSNSSTTSWTERIGIAVDMADSATFITIFTFFLKSAWQQLLEESAKLFLFSGAALFSFLQMIVAWRNAETQKNKEAWLNAGVSTLAGIGVTFAVLTSFLAAATIGVFAPYIFTGIMVFKTLFGLGSCAYNLYQAYTANNEEDTKKYKAKAFQYAVGAFSMALAAIAVPLVMIALKPIMAIFGIVSGALGLVYGSYKAYKSFTPKGSPGSTKEPLLKAGASDNPQGFNPSLRLIISPCPPQQEKGKITKGNTSDHKRTLSSPNLSLEGAFTPRDEGAHHRRARGDSWDDAASDLLRSSEITPEVNSEFPAPK